MLPLYTADLAGESPNRPRRWYRGLGIYLLLARVGSLSLCLGPSLFILLIWTVPTVAGVSIRDFSTTTTLRGP